MDSSFPEYDLFPGLQVFIIKQHWGLLRKKPSTFTTSAGAWCRAQDKGTYPGAEGTQEDHCLEISGNFKRHTVQYTSVSLC